MFKFKQPSGDKEPKITGSSSMPLNKEGIDQAEEIASNIKDSNVNKVYYSPTERAKDTAEVLKEKLPDAKFVESSGLHPWHLGAMEGQPESDTTAEQVKLIKSPDAPAKGEGPLSTHKGESFNSFKDRFIGQVRQLMHQYEKTGKTIAAVTHSRNVQILQGWNKAKFSSNYTPTIHDMFAKTPDTGSLHRLYKTSTGWKLECCSEKPKGKGIIFIRHGKTDWD